MRNLQKFNGIPPVKIDHMNLRVTDVDKALEYWQALDFSISEYVQDENGKFAAWTRRAATTHDVALVRTRKLPFITRLILLMVLRALFVQQIYLPMRVIVHQLTMDQVVTAQRMHFSYIFVTQMVIVWRFTRMTIVEILMRNQLVGQKKNMIPMAVCGGGQRCQIASLKQQS